MVAAVGVAAHEAGHALQHQAAYGPLHLRMALVPVTQFASYAWIGIMLLGMFLVSSKLIWVAIAVFSGFHDLLRSQATGTIPEGSIDPLTQVAHLDDVRPDDQADCQRIADLLNAAFRRDFHNA